MVELSHPLSFSLRTSFQKNLLFDSRSFFYITRIVITNSSLKIAIAHITLAPSRPFTKTNFVNVSFVYISLYQKHYKELEESIFLSVYISVSLNNPPIIRH